MAGSDALAPASGSGSALASASSAISQGSADIDANREGMKSALSDYQADKARIDKQEASLGDAPKLEALPKAPERQDSDPGRAFGSAAMALAVLGSTLTRQHLTSALNGATGVINAYKQNDAAAADQKYDEWKVNTANALKLHQYAMDSYKTSLDKLRDDRTGATAELNAKFKAFGDDNAAAVLQEQGAEGLSKLFMERDRQALEMERTSEELGEKHKTLQEQHKLLDDIKAARASGDPEALKKAQQAVVDYQTVNTPGGALRTPTGTGAERFVERDRQQFEVDHPGEPYPQDRELEVRKKFADASKAAGSPTSIKALETAAWLKEQTVANGRPPTAAEIEDHRKEMDQAKPTESDESADRRAKMAIAGDFQGAIAGLGRGKEATANYALIDDHITRLAKERGLSGEDLAVIQAEYRGVTAAERTLANREVIVGQGRHEMDRLIPQVLEASAAVQRGQYPNANALYQAAQKADGSKELKTFATKLQALENAYTQVLTRGGARSDAAQATAHELFSTTDPADVTAAVLTAIEQEGGAVAGSVADSQADLANKIRGGKPGAAPAKPFNSVADAEKAAAAGQLHNGDRVTINGRSATWQE